MISEKACIKERYIPVKSENSTCATLCGHLSNSRILMNSLIHTTPLYVIKYSSLYFLIWSTLVNPLLYILHIHICLVYLILTSTTKQAPHHISSLTPQPPLLCPSNSVLEHTTAPRPCSCGVQAPSETFITHPTKHCVTVYANLHSSCII